jgi:hypothetical protein
MEPAPERLLQNPDADPDKSVDPLTKVAAPFSPADVMERRPEANIKILLVDAEGVISTERLVST